MAIMPISDARRRYFLVLLFVVSVINFVDRQILAILLPDIKAELGLSDTQLGFLTGIAFAVLYATLGIPLARLADRWNRKKLIALSVALWSAMTALSGLAQNFLHLALARVAVGVGEAGCSPSSYSLISDYFPPGRRASAISIYTLGISVGVLLGFLLGGWVNEYFGWRTAFFVVGFPGVLVALVVLVTLYEPPRGHADGLLEPKHVPNLSEVARHLLASRSYRNLIAGVCLVSIDFGCVLQWMPSMFMRSHDLTPGQVGSWFALVVGIAGGVGTLVGGYWSDHLSKSDKRWYMWLPGLAVLASLPFACVVLLWPVPETALLTLSMVVILYAIHLGPFGAVMQDLANVRTRASVTAISLAIVNLVGLGVGPQIVGILSDVLHPAQGDDSLRISLFVVMMVASVWSAWHYFRASTNYRSELHRSQGISSDIRP